MKLLCAALFLNVESTAAFVTGDQFRRHQSHANSRNNVLLRSPAGLSLSALSSNKKHENIVPSSLTQLNERQSTELNFSSYTLPDTSDPFSILNLESTVKDLKTIKIAYRKMVVKYHPDTITNASSTDEERHIANEEFARINAAYAILSGKSPDPSTAKDGRTREKQSRTPESSFYNGMPFPTTPMGTMGFSKGDVVRITSGAHARRSGVVEVIYPEKRLVRLLYNNSMSIFVESKYCQLQDWSSNDGFVYMTGDVYEGGWEMGEPHGKGVLNFISGAVYEGEYASGKQHGTGTCTLPNGDFYSGEWKDDKPHGRGEGKFTSDDGDSYEGEFLNGKIHGVGRCSSANNEVFEGQWKHGFEDGQGGCMFANGDIYEGDWKEGKMCGVGKYTSASGEVYMGEWQEGKECGQGKCKFPSGDVYVGAWKDGNENGLGMCTFANKDVYEGYWGNGKIHGDGKYVYGNGDIYKGRWYNGKRDGQGTYIFTSGDMYQGGWIKNLKSGEGKYIFSDGEEVVGLWKEDVFQEQDEYEQ